MAIGVLGALALIGGGTHLQAKGASKKRKQLESYQQADLPNIPLYTQNYFGDLSRYEDQSRGMAMRANEDLTNLSLSRRERSTPGISNLIAEQVPQVANLMKGELPESVLNAFRTSGAANSVGLGFSGSGYGDLNQALFGARGSLGAMELGYSLLPTLLGAAPQFGTTSPTSFLEGIITPAQQAQTQLGVRGQNVGIASQVAGMQTSSDVWGGMMSGLGGMLLGGMMGGGGMGGGMGGMGGGGFGGYGGGYGGYGGNGVSRLYGY